MRLTPGQTAPDFDATDVFGIRHSLLALKGRKVMLSFYRYSGCPFCNLRVAEMIRAFPDLDSAGLVMLSFWQSSRSDILSYVGQQKPPFPMIADPEKNIYDTYGIENHRLAPWKVLLQPKLAYQAITYRKLGGSGEVDLVPADYLVNGDQTIDTAFHGSHIGDHIPLDDVWRFLKT